MKYAFMSDNTGKFCISTQSKAFGVSRSGYYAWRYRLENPSRRQLFREKLDPLVAEAFTARKGRSGAVGLTLDFDEQGHSYNRKTVAKSLRRQGHMDNAARKFKATMIPSTICPWLRTDWNRILMQTPQTGNGSAASPIFGPAKDGFIYQ